MTRAAAESSPDPSSGLSSQPPGSSPVAARGVDDGSRVTVRPIARTSAGVGSQTLDRGLRVLEIVAFAGCAVTTAQVGERLGLHRSITYRMLRTLEARRLLARDAAGGWLPAAGLAVLASTVAPQIREAADGVLSRLADECGMTAFLVLAEDDEAVTVSVVEPRAAAAHVTYRPGRRHPLTRGAPGLALLAGRSVVAGERPEVALARTRGWAYSASEVLPGMKAVSVPVVDRDGMCGAAISVLFVGEPDLDEVGSRVIAAARRLEERLRLGMRHRTD